MSKGTSMLLSKAALMRKLFASASVIALLPAAFGLAQSQSISADEEITRLVQRLYPTRVGEAYKAPGYETAMDAKKRLLAIAQSGTEQRGKVVKALIEFVEDLLSKVAGGAREMAGWVGTNLLGELKATEAVDMLIKYIDHDYRYQNGMIDYAYPTPSCGALVSIGEPAVPKLAEALSRAEAWSVRMVAAITLGYIGGSAAQAALEQARPKETNVQVKTAIQLAQWWVTRKATKK